MRTPRVTVDVPLDVGSTAELSAAEGRHLVTVLRRGLGDGVEVLAPNGVFRGVVEANEDGRQARVRVTAEIDAPDSRAGGGLRLGIAVVKGAAFDTALRAAVELGVDAVAPLRTERTIVKWDESRRRSRCDRVITEAMKQCGRATPLELEAAEDLRVWLARPAGAQERRILLDPAGSLLDAAAGRAASRTVAIGPEGGFSASEREAAESLGWEVRRLPVPVLRTPTAVAVAAALWLLGQPGD